jgi:hypothetical protein
MNDALTVLLCVMLAAQVLTVAALVRLWDVCERMRAQVQVLRPEYIKREMKL